MRYLIIFTIIFSSCSFTKPNVQNEKSIYRKWLVYKYKAGSVTELTNEEAETLIGKNISISKNELNIFDDSYSEYQVKEDEVDVEKYFDSFKFDYKKLDLKQKKGKLYSFVSQDEEGSDLYFDFLYFGDLVVYNTGGFFFYLK